ncbi:hypothetical protein ACFX13_009386 [Malus domestica]
MPPPNLLGLLAVTRMQKTTLLCWQRKISKPAAISIITHIHLLLLCSHIFAKIVINLVFFFNPSLGFFPSSGVSTIFFPLLAPKLRFRLAADELGKSEAITFRIIKSNWTCKQLGAKLSRTKIDPLPLTSSKPNFNWFKNESASESSRSASQIVKYTKEVRCQSKEEK